MHQQPTSPLPVDPPAAAPPPGPPGPPPLASPPVAAPGGGGQVGRVLDRWLDLLWVRVPGALRRLGSLPALAAADGAYLSAWPPVGAAVPPVAFLVGLLIGWLRFGLEFSFSESLGIMGLFAFVAFACGAGPGLWLWTGYAIGDFLLYGHPTASYGYRSNPLEEFVRVRGSWLILYALLALLLVVFPLTASALRRVTPLPGRALRRPGLGATLAEGGIYVATAALLVYSWIQAVPILQRPIFTWRGGTPTVEAVAQLQQRGGWVLLAALLGAVARIALEALSWRDAGARERQARFGALLARAEQRAVSWTRVPLPVRLVAGALLTVLLLSGMLPGVGDGIVLLVLLAGIFLGRQYLSDLAPPWYAVMSKVPLVLRLLAAVLLSRLLVPPLLERLWSGVDFRPILITTLVGLILATLLTPPPPRPRVARPTVAQPPTPPYPPPGAPPGPPPGTPPGQPGQPGPPPMQPLEAQR